MSAIPTTYWRMNGYGEVLIYTVQGRPVKPSSSYSCNPWSLAYRCRFDQGWLREDI
jgi:hypothetical protein